MNGYYPEGIQETPLPDLAALKRAKECGTILEAPVTRCDGKMNLHIALDGTVGIIPREEVLLPIGNESIKDIAILTRVGKRVCFHVKEIIEEGGGPRFILSRRSAQRECLQMKLKRLCPGDVIETRVTHIEPFGIFLDIGCGLASLLPIDAISVSRIAHPKLRHKIGEVLKVVVKSVSTDGRVTATRRELLGTWEENAALFNPGETVFGIIRSIESYGIFVELTPNLTGLAELHAGVSLNAGATVYIKSILKERMKIKLIVLDIADKPPFLPLPSVFLDATHIDYWRYSPIGAQKVIETHF